MLSPETVRPLAPRPAPLPGFMSALAPRGSGSPGRAPAASPLGPRTLPLFLPPPPPSCPGLIAAGGGGPGRGRRVCPSSRAGDAPVPQAPPSPRAHRGTAVTASCRSPGYSPKYLLATSPARPDNLPR